MKTKTITIEIPVKQYYQQEFQKLKKRETGLRQKIKNTKGYIQSYFKTENQIQAVGLHPAARFQTHQFAARRLTKQEIIDKLNDDFDLIVDFVTDDYDVVLVKQVHETPEEIAERIKSAKAEIEQCRIRAETEQQNLETLEAELAELLAEIKGFWTDPIRQANLKESNE